jgi:SNF2 family DNA or RNA helicase
VIAPKSILEPAWAKDMKAFAPNIKVSIAYASNRTKAFAIDADMYVTNTDAAVWLSKQPAKFFKRFSHLIIDESTSFKHATSARSKAMAKVATHFKVRRLLSGTATPNSITDIWHQMKILDGGRRLGNSFFQFRASVCTPEQNGPLAQHIKWSDREGAELAVSSLLRDITIRHELRKCIDMPENILYSVPYTLNAKNMAYYQKMEANSILEIKAQRVTAVNGAVLYNKLLQIASGAVYDEAGGYVRMDTGRYGLVADVAEARAHSIIFFQWQHQKDMLEKELTARGMSYAVIDGSVSSHAKRNEIVDGFQKGMYRTLLLHPQSTAHGLTLTRATAAIWPSPTVNAEHWIQGNHRHDRNGQTQRTETIVFTAVGTRDEYVFARCKDKTLNMTNLLGEFT